MKHSPASSIVCSGISIKIKKENSAGRLLFARLIQSGQSLGARYRVVPLMIISSFNVYELVAILITSESMSIFQILIYKFADLLVLII